MADRGKRQREDQEDSEEARKRIREESDEAYELLLSAQERMRSVEMRYPQSPENLFDIFEGFNSDRKLMYLVLLLESWDKLSPEQQEKHKGIGPQYVLEMALQQADKRARESKMDATSKIYTSVRWNMFNSVHRHYIQGRYRGKQHTLLATSTQGNCFEEVVSNEWMLKYGRLLWWSLYLSNLAQDPAIYAFESCQDPH
ncbi:hypothetical protein SELMODRAFT_430824 [Selaginella moellendorffii]|uniref:Uncharacterized protein n=1 Tax=Selaginella moellendorffii TaxID=88036 RepID=D8TAM9_SELML|nr:hypothetical protein SELMODRAFT_430824 [Selaginella moellendorffii]